MGVEAKQWKPPNKLDVPTGYKEAGFAYKFVEKDRLSNRQREGWEIAPFSGKRMKGEVVSADGGHHVRELILCRMPQDMADQRNAYYANKANRAMQSITKGSQMRQDTKSVNADANKARGVSGESFVQATGKVMVSNHGTAELEPMLDQKQVEADLQGLDKE